MRHLVAGTPVVKPNGLSDRRRLRRQILRQRPEVYPRYLITNQPVFCPRENASAFWEMIRAHSIDVGKLINQPHVLLLRYSERGRKFHQLFLMSGLQFSGSRHRVERQFHHEGFLLVVEFI